MPLPQRQSHLTLYKLHSAKSDFVKVDELRWQFVLKYLFICSPRVITGVLKKIMQCQYKVTSDNGRVLRQRELKVLCHSLLDKGKAPESQKRQENRAY